jgi:hypothetical protein
MHPFKGNFLPSQLCKKSRGVAAESTKFRDRKGSEADAWRLLTPSEYFSTFVFSTRLKAALGDGGLGAPNKTETPASRASFEPRMPW